jgi:radical SAM superfamily enzyme YgiQ (UPF0313 family)
MCIVSRHAMSVLLIHPPVSKPSEPPPGIARLSAALKHHGIPCTVLDANIEGLLWLLRQHCPAEDTWTRRAVRTRDTHISSLRSAALYQSIERYTRAVHDLNRAMHAASRQYQARAGLTDYADTRRSPLRSTDLLAAADMHAGNPFFGYFSRRIPELLDNKRPAVIGVSLNFLSQALCAFALIGFLRHCIGNVPIVLGGGLITSWMRRPGFANPFSGMVDHLIDGPGEEALVEYVATQCSPAAALSHPPVQASAAMGQVLPEYSSTPFDTYLAPGRILPYSASSGCYWNSCTFCPEHAEGTAYRPIAPLQAARDVQELVRQYDPVLVHFCDNALSPAHLKALIHDPPGVQWYGFARITDQLMDSDFCHALRASGCCMLKLGIESGDDGVLEQMHKGITTAMASRALTNLQQAGIATYVYLLFGTPYESEPEADTTLAFTLRHLPAISFLNLAIFNMPADAGESMPAHWHFYPADVSLYTDFEHPHGWSRILVRQFLERRFKRHPGIAGILTRDPPFFTSNHAAFFGGNILLGKAFARLRNC